MANIPNSSWKCFRFFLDVVNKKQRWTNQLVTTNGCANLILSKFLPVCNNIVFCYIVLCYVVLCYVVLCHVDVLCYVMFSYIVLCYVVLCCIVLRCVVLCRVMLYFVVLCCIMFCCVLLCCISCPEPANTMSPQPRQQLL